jgi:hypothetical protein
MKLSGIYTFSSTLYKFLVSIYNRMKLWQEFYGYPRISTITKQGF